jgi:hypothetical protein
LRRALKAPAGRGRLFLIALAAGWAVPVVTAHASPPLPLELTWEAPPECPSGDAVRAQVERVVRVRRGRTAPHLIAMARVEQRGGRWFLRLRTERGGVIGQRQLEAATCAPLVGAATLVLGLAFGEGVELSADPLVLDQTSTIAPDPSDQKNGSEAAPAPAPPEKVAPPPPTPAPAPAAQGKENDKNDNAPADLVVAGGRRRSAAAWSPSLVWAVSAEGRSSWGPVPGQAFGFGLGLDLGGRRWFGNLQLGAVPSAEETLTSGVRVRFAELVGAASLCARAAVVRSVTIAGCLGIQGSAVRARSVGSTNDGEATAPLYAALPAVRVEVPLFRAVSLQAGAALATSLHRPIFAIDGLGDVYRVPRLAPSVSLGLGVRW